MNCPDCGGAMWDNRADKRNPKSPDFRCKNAQCAKAVWEKKGEASAPVSTTPVAQNGNGHAAPAGTRALGPLYNECLEFAKAASVHHFGDKATPDVIVAATATLFIQAVRDGAPIRPVRTKPAPPPPPPEPVYDPYQDDRSLPF